MHPQTLSQMTTWTKYDTERLTEMLSLRIDLHCSASSDFSPGLRTCVLLFRSGFTTGKYLMKKLGPGPQPT
jgi:hypothetical protein